MNRASEKILFVDDDQKILNAMERYFVDILPITTVSCPEQGLELFKEDTFSVIVSDMRMPRMNGIELLTKVRACAPDTVRIMLTGYADLQSTIDAVNEGHIFRFLSKPCSLNVIESAIRAGIEQYRLIRAEQELLEGTLHGSIKVLSEMLSIVKPGAFGRTSSVQKIALAIGMEMQIESLWDLKIAAMLFPLGYITVADDVLEVALKGEEPSAMDLPAIGDEIRIAERMLRQIPRLGGVAEIVGYQAKNFDGTGLPVDSIRGLDIPLGARILRVASDFDLVHRQTGNVQTSMSKIEGRVGFYDELVLRGLKSALRSGLCQSTKRVISIESLEEGNVLACDVFSKRGQLMVACGQEVTEALRVRLLDLMKRGTIGGELHVEEFGCLSDIEMSAF
ncbi:MAG: response regulator [Fuerstiella sp.]